MVPWKIPSLAGKRGAASFQEASVELQIDRVSTNQRVYPGDWIHHLSTFKINNLDKYPGLTHYLSTSYWLLNWFVKGLY